MLLLTLDAKVGALHAPLQFVWLSSLFFVIGGGPTTGTTLITTIVADVVPPEIRYVHPASWISNQSTDCRHDRSTIFFYRFCSDLVAECFTPPVTAVLMSRNIWIPLIIAVLFQGIGAALVLILPETLPISHLEVEAEHSTENLPSSETVEEPCLKAKGRAWILKITEALEFVTRDKSVAALVFTFLISKVGRQSINIMLQYVSTRYGWPLSKVHSPNYHSKSSLTFGIKANLLLSVRAGVNIALFTLILPAVVTITNTRTTAATRDLWIAKASIILMILGTLSLFLSTTVALMIIGNSLYLPVL
jgi:hypothetical protein